MAGRTPAQQYNALMTYYLSQYKKRYNTVPPEWNRNLARHTFKDMFEDYGYEDAKSIIDYFFGLEVGAHPHNKLRSMYGRIYQSIQDDAADREQRMRIRRETEERVRKARGGN
jgi:hypothetical protein